MKQIIRIVCFIILIPLLPALTQAALISASDCIHCRKLQVSKLDCCTVMDRSSTEIDGAKAAKDDEFCPHAGFCQGEIGPAAQLLPYPVSFEIAAPVSFVPVAFRSSQPDSSWCDVSPLSTLKPPLRLFTLNCSFLI
jgi:hypothetical protein